MKQLIFLLFCFLSFSVFAQTDGNEWIQYDRPHYKFPITETGVYRISFQDLQSAGIPISTISPAEFRVFGRGEELPLYIPNESDGSFDASDYIEFYAEANDGWLDTTFYGSKAKQANPYYSLINDTIFYFLSWGNGTNRRFQLENNINFGNYFASNLIWKESLQSYNTTYYGGETYSGGATNPRITPEEGWMDAALSLGQSRNKILNLAGHINSGPTVEMDIKLVGASNPSTVNDHHIRITRGAFSLDTVFDGYKLIHLQRSVPANFFFDGNNTISIQSVDDLGASVDRTATAYIKLLYPRNLNFNNQSQMDFWLDDNISQNASLLEVFSFNGGNNPILYDLSNNKRIRVVTTLGSDKAIVPNSGGRKHCLLLNSSNVKSIARLIPVGTNALFTDFSTLFTDTTFLILTHPQLYNEATTYAAYRRSASMNAEVVNVTDLYDQYAYGIPLHPLAIRNFVKEGLTQWAFPPSHLLLLGKSVSAISHRKNTQNQALNLVPSFGNPATDNLLLSGIDPNSIAPAIPLGRVSARNRTEVDIYLDKLIEYETAPRAAWMKEALHFAGGRSVGESNIYETYLNDYKQDFSTQFYGGNVRLFKKSSSAPIQTTLADSIRNLINSGVSLMTFFGHASANDGFDISIDTPDKLQNRGKYPLMLANSCFTGNYHQASSISTGEDYVLERNKGAIGYIATGNLGFAFYLNQYSRNFYENLSIDFYGSSIGEVMRQTMINLEQNNTNIQLERVALEMSLQGDPALVLNPLPNPDYRLVSSNLRSFPTEISTENDSFRISIIAENIGKAIEDSVVLTLRRNFPDASKADTTYVRQLYNLFNRQELTFTLPIDAFTDVGENDFTIIIDPFDEKAEISEFNNRLDFSLLIRSGEILPVYPYNQAVIGQQNPTLSASTAYAFEETKSYLFELDTTINFNSQAKETTTITSSGGLIEWTPNLLSSMPDSAVYFWRASKLPAPGETFNWKTNSFQYLPNKTGWGQTNFRQFDENNLLFLRQNIGNQKLEFTPNVKELYVFTKSSPSLSETFSIRYSVDADVRERNACGGTPAFLIAVLDSLSLESWQTPYNGANPNNYFGQANFDNYCGADRQRSEKYFMFRQNDSAQMVSMRDFLLQDIPDGNYIVIYSWQNIDYSQIRALDPTVLDAIKQLGSNLIDSLDDDHPFIFTVKKGDPTTVQEIRGFSAVDEIDLSRTLTVSADFGEMTTNAIGGSIQWQQFHYRCKKTDVSDSVVVAILGMNGNNQTELYRSRNFVSDSVLNIPIQTNTFDHLQMKVIVEDQLAQTAPQLQNWHLFYEILPDLAFAPNHYANVPTDSLQRGQNFQFELAYANPTSQATDSVSIAYRVVNSGGQTRMMKTLKLAPLPAFSYDTLRLDLSTSALSGQNRLYLELNPAQAQKEQFTFNNRAEYSFIISGDQLNPLLDVTFDGRRIMNREIVSARPDIVIQLEDENQFLALDDTSSFSIYLRKPNGNEELINFSQNDRIVFSPATLPQNKAKVNYQPELTEDGVYRLRISARDKSGNEIGQQNYSIEFEIINRSTVSYLLNYPNPFSTSTRFVFTLTGSRIPDQIQIQIMTITGKVVKQIDQFELGPIHIGKNISQYAWDGKDEFGDQLANGVYLYRVKMKIGGNNIERRNTEIDKYFTKEFGKMYLLR